MGHEIILNSVRTKIRSFSIRFIFSLCLAFLALLVSRVFFGHENVFENAFCYYFYLFLFKIKSAIPIFKLKISDIHHIAFNYSLMMKDFLFWKWSLLFSSFIFFSCFLVTSYLFHKKGERHALEQIMRGNKLISSSDHNKVMKEEYHKKLPFEMGHALILGKDKVIIPESLQYLHFAFIGTSGCGKSTAIGNIIPQVQKRQEKAFIVDLNGSLFSQFGRPCDHILSLRDPRTRSWDFWSEEDVEFENLAASMIEATGDHNSFFWKGARAVLTSLLKNTKNNHELWEDFKKNTADIRKKLEENNDISQRIIGYGDNEQADGILGSAVLDFHFLKELNQWNDESEEKLSITKWIQNNTDRSWIYLVVSDKDIEITKPLLRVWFDLACLGCLNRDANNPENVHTWLIVDELKSLGQLQKLPAILDKGRKYKTSVVLGFQAISQVQKIYGDKDAQSILQGVQNQFFYRMNDDYSASYASTSLGEQELEQVNLGVSFGQGKIQDRGSLNKTATRRKVVLADEIKSLKFLHCYAKLGPHLPFKMEFEVFPQKRRNDPAISKINPEYVIGKEHIQIKEGDPKKDGVPQSLPWLHHNEENL